jgi:chromosome segregation ATPase
MLRDWLLNISITFGLGLCLGLVFNSGNPLLSGLQAATAAAVGTAIVTRGKRSRFQKNSAALRSQISRLQNKSHALQHNILTATAEQAQITTELDAYYQRQQAATQHISALETARQRMTAESQQLQDQLTSLQAERTNLKDSMAKIAINRQQLLGDKQEPTSELNNSNQQLELEQQELKTAIDRLKSEEHNLAASIAELHNDRQQLLIEQQQPAAELSDSRQQLAELQAAIDQLKSQEQGLAASITQITLDRQQLLNQQANLQAQSSSFQQQLELEKQELSTVIAQLESQKMKSISESRQLEADISQLATSKQSLELEVEQLHQKIADIQQLTIPTTLANSTTESIDSQLDVDISISAIPSAAAENWQERFEDEMVRSVFVQLQKYGSVTEAELTQMLAGNPRKARQFALKFEEYLQLVPFSARVEIAASGKRYVRE